MDASRMMGWMNSSNQTDWPSYESPCDRYGLTKGQTRLPSRRLVTNGLWCDHKWQMFGWGDLSDDDVVRIAKRIPFGELFIVVNTRIHPIQYEASNCLWLVERGHLYRVLFSDNLSDETAGTINGVPFRRIVRPTAASVVERFQRLNSG
jgi:hypothetical protein